MTTSTADHTLARTVSLPGAIMLGLGSMIGTGVFVTIALATAETGGSVVIAVPIAACVAMCNALSSAQLAAAHPVSGGTYEYAYRFLSPRLGFTAGWMFVCAKVASASAAAMGFGAYLAELFIPSASRIDEGGKLAAKAELIARGAPLVAAVLLTLLVLAGLRRSNIINTLIVSITLAALVIFIGTGVYATTLPRNVGEPGIADNFQPFMLHGVPGFLEACALMFVAYTGFGRLATLGEEVREPQRTIPRAIIATMLACVLLYTAVGVTAIATAGAGSFATSVRDAHAAAMHGPLAQAAQQFGRAGPMVAWIVNIGACTAMLGVLLNLILGVSRVVMAMGRRGDLPSTTAILNRSRTTPFLAVILVGLAISVAAAAGGIKAVWSFSAFTVLVYYAITNAACLRLPRELRLYPRVFAWIGLGACIGLAFWVEPRIWVTGLGLIGVGLIWQALRTRGRRRRADLG